MTPLQYATRQIFEEYEIEDINTRCVTKQLIDSPVIAPLNWKILH
jgi:hypothetical protein